MSQDSYPGKPVPEYDHGRKAIDELAQQALAKARALGASSTSSTNEDLTTIE